MAQTSFAEGDPNQRICLDILLPRMGGNEALVVIRTAEEASECQIQAKTILTSSLEDSTVILKSFRLQCDEFIKKTIPYHY